MRTHIRVAQTFPIDIGLLIHNLEVRAVGPGHQPLIGNLRPQHELMMYHDEGGRFTLPSVFEITNYTIFHDFATQLLLADHASLRLTTPANGGRVRLHVPFMPRTGWYIDLEVHNVR